MERFPRTAIRTVTGEVKVSRLVIGTNWFRGWTHCTKSKDKFIKENVHHPKKMAAILATFFRRGVNAILCDIMLEHLDEAIMRARKHLNGDLVIFSTFGGEGIIGPWTPTDGPKLDALKTVLDAHKKQGEKLGATVVSMPHQCITDALVDHCTRKIRHIDTITQAIRDRGMIPGLSTHMAETIRYADETGIDAETYISVYNAMGYMMLHEVDWTTKVIREAYKPVLVVKALAAGQLRPLQGMSFAWNTIREQDMIAVGTSSPDEAEELIDLSLDMIDEKSGGFTPPRVDPQVTRSKAFVNLADSKNKGKNFKKQGYF